jgi:hypothetical protein
MLYGYLIMKKLNIYQKTGITLFTACLLASQLVPVLTHVVLASTGAADKNDILASSLEQIRTVTVFHEDEYVANSNWLSGYRLALSQQALFSLRAT